MPMPSGTPDTAEEAKQSLYHYATHWGENSFPPTATAALIAAQHLRPPQYLPLMFPPILLFSSYLNLQGFKTDAAGLTSAWSAAYLVLARRRKQGFTNKFGARGLVRGGTVALCAVNVVSGGLVYAFGKREGKDGEGT